MWIATANNRIEDLVQGYAEPAQTVLTFLEIPIPPDLRIGTPKIKRQADALTEAWIRLNLAEETQ